jgi:hypothetical protein
MKKSPRINICDLVIPCSEKRVFLKINQDEFSPKNTEQQLIKLEILAPEKLNSETVS